MVTMSVVFTCLHPASSKTKSMTNILRAATLTLCLTFSTISHAAIQSAAIPQTDSNAKPVDHATAPNPDQNGIYKVGGNVLPPKLIYSVEPKIAKKDHKRTKWGKTITLVQITVDAEGQVQNAHVVKSSLETMKSKGTEAAAIIDQSCLDAVNQYRFEPSTLEGKPIPVLINVEIKFRIF